jgi:hypothetical protein
VRVEYMLQPLLQGGWWCGGEEAGMFSPPPPRLAGDKTRDVCEDAS